MTQINHPKPTDAELEILRILWSNGPSTVRNVNVELNEKREVGYTTTLKQMQIMIDKGLLSRKKSGKTHIYEAKATETITQKKLVEKLLDTAFQGSAMKLVMQALGNRKSTAEELQEIKNFIHKLEGGKK